eukprot:m.161164 g.161164  ORF g.161164 m.161164 type:complete len:175 (+) comp16373_c3_seq4:128-652(+)
MNRVVLLLLLAFIGAASAVTCPCFGSHYTCPDDQECGYCDDDDDSSNINCLAAPCCDRKLVKNLTTIIVGAAVGAFVLCVLFPVCYCFCVGAACFAGCRKRNTNVTINQVQYRQLHQDVPMTPTHTQHMQQPAQQGYAYPANPYPPQYAPTPQAYAVPPPPMSSGNQAPPYLKR